MNNNIIKKKLDIIGPSPQPNDLLLSWLLVLPFCAAKRVVSSCRVSMFSRRTAVQGINVLTTCCNNDLFRSYTNKNCCYFPSWKKFCFTKCSTLNKNRLFCMFCKRKTMQVNEHFQFLSPHSFILIPTFGF